MKYGTSFDGRFIRIYTSASSRSDQFPNGYYPESIKDFVKSWLDSDQTDGKFGPWFILAKEDSTLFIRLMIQSSLMASENPGRVW